jgi:hypothetical protein
MDNVQNCDSYINIPSAQTDRSNYAVIRKAFFAETCLKRNIFQVRYDSAIRKILMFSFAAVN